MTLKRASISPIYERGQFKRKGPKKPQKNDSTTTLEHSLSRFGARLNEVNLLRSLERGKSLTVTDATQNDPIVMQTMFNNYCRAVACLNKVKAFGEFYIRAQRGPVDPSNKFTIKINPRKQKSFVKPGEIKGFIVTRL